MWRINFYFLIYNIVGGESEWYNRYYDARYWLLFFFSCRLWAVWVFTWGPWLCYENIVAVFNVFVSRWLDSGLGALILRMASSLFYSSIFLAVCRSVMRSSIGSLAELIVLALWTYAFLNVRYMSSEKKQRQMLAETVKKSILCVFYLNEIVIIKRMIKVLHTEIIWAMIERATDTV